jgi:peptidyl-prolyl cis-trans isomerase B (cyclophilin B)
MSWNNRTCLSLDPLRCLTVSLGWLLLLGIGTLSAHEQGEASAPELISISPTTRPFQDRTQALRQVMGEMLELEVLYHNSDTTKDEVELKERWYKKRDEVYTAYQAMLQTCLAEFLEAPNERQPLADYLYGQLKASVKRGEGKGWLPIAQALLDQRYPADDIISLYVQCCVTNNRFDLARAPYAKLVEDGQASAELVKLYQELQSMELAWQRELEAQSKDTSGPPLPQARVHTTKGSFVIELFENQAPEAVANFVQLAEKGFYKSHDFFMVIDNQLAQTGCPKSDGTGGPGYFIPEEEKSLEPRGLFSGYVGLALLKDLPDSGGSQFYINFLPQMMLGPEQGASRVFGRVISGMHNVCRLTRIDPKAKKDESQPPPVADEILSIEIIGKRDHAYEPTRLSQPMVNPN